MQRFYESEAGIPFRFWRLSTTYLRLRFSWPSRLSSHPWTIMVMD